jgi:hypothetical protein
MYSLLYSLPLLAGDIQTPYSNAWGCSSARRAESTARYRTSCTSEYLLGRPMVVAVSLAETILCPAKAFCHRRLRSSLQSWLRLTHAGTAKRENPMDPQRVRRDEKYAGDGRGVAEATHLRLAEWPHGGSHLGAFLASSFHRASRSPCVHTNRPQPTTSRPSATRHLTGHTKALSC